MPSVESAQRHLAGIQSDIANVRKRQSLAQQQSGKERKAAATKRDRARRTSVASSAARYLREAEKHDAKAADYDKKAADHGKKLAALTGKEVTAAQALARAQREASKAIEREAAKRRRNELQQAQELARLSQAVNAVHRTAPPQAEPLRVVYLTAAPDQDLRVDVEVREVREAVKRSLHGLLVDIDHWPAAKVEDITHALNDKRPHVIHFSGHTHNDGDDLVFDNADVLKPQGVLLTFDLFAKIVAATDSPPRLIVLNTCDSYAGAERLLDVAEAVIAMVDPIGDLAAKLFASKFYAAVASGQSVATAVQQGKVALEIAGTGEQATPEVIARPGTDLTETKLVAPSA
jgi:CHAT domain